MFYNLCFFHDDLWRDIKLVYWPVVICLYWTVSNKGIKISKASLMSIVTPFLLDIHRLITNVEADRLHATQDGTLWRPIKQVFCSAVPSARLAAGRGRRGARVRRAAAPWRRADPRRRPGGPPPPPARNRTPHRAGLPTSQARRPVYQYTLSIHPQCKAVWRPFGTDEDEMNSMVINMRYPYQTRRHKYLHTLDH